MFSSKLYDRLKWIAQIALPAVGALYFGLAQIWGLPEGENVVGSIVVLDTFLGALLGFSSKQYNDNPDNYAGYISTTGGVDPDTGIPDIKLVVRQHPEEIVQNGVARFKVGPAPENG